MRLSVLPETAPLGLRLARDILAAKRLVRLAVDDSVAAPVRELIWRYDPPDKNRLGYVLTCHSCSSFWAALMVVTGCLPGGLRDTLALSETAILLERLETRFLDF